MINEVYKAIHSHRSIRKFQDKPVEEDKLNRILNAATRASSSGNMQAYSIIATQRLSLKRKLFSPHFKQSMVLEAPVFLTFCADFNRKRKWLEKNNAPENFDNFMSFMIASIDAILASQNAALAAESEGLGICYLGTTLASTGEIAEILNCPPGVVPVVGFALGYPDEQIDKKDRLPLEGIIHHETYKDYTDSDIDSIYKDKEESGKKRYEKAYPDNEELKDLNLAQIYTKIKYTRESHLKYSKDVLETIERQGFMNNS